MELRAANYVQKISPTKIIFAGYCIIIMIGTALLSLPLSVREGNDSSVLTAFFTATSATCVTGLVRVDTYAHWSLFGQTVILMLIQIGGVGFMTFCIFALSITKRKIGFASRSLMQNSISALQLSGMVRMTRFILLGTLIIEGTGAVLLSVFFCPKMGFVNGVWCAIFHSVSAFCNAGFDIMGRDGAFVSLTSAVGNWYVNIVVMLLIVTGGLGFFVWKDVLNSKFRFSQMNLQTKIVIFISGLLIFGGGLSIFLIERGGSLYNGMSLSEQIAASLFQSVSTRTAGFNTVNISAMTQSSLFMMICLMLIGGSPGSTAGGIKTTTFTVLMLSIMTTFRRRKSVEIFGRRMEDGICRTASCVFMMYMILVCTVSMFISRLEGIPILDALFECVSAICTVGLTTGVTTEMSTVSAMLLAGLMIFGRVGSLTTLLAFSSDRRCSVSALPHEKIQIG